MKVQILPLMFLLPLASHAQDFHKYCGGHVPLEKSKWDLCANSNPMASILMPKEIESLRYAPLETKEGTDLACIRQDVIEHIVQVVCGSSPK